MTTKVLDIEEMQELLDELVFKPFAQEGWSFEVELDEKDSNYVILTLVNGFGRDSRSFDFGSDTDDWSLMDGRRQTFTERHVGLWIAVPDELYKAAVHLVAYAGAHESVEWLRRWEDQQAVIMHDPHEDGDVEVKL